MGGCRFIIRTDHDNLKFMLDQSFSTIPQPQCISKLFGFDFAMEHQPGRLNTVVDALSRRDVDQSTLLAVFGSTFKLYDDIRREVDTNPDMVAVCGQILAGDHGEPWTMVPAGRSHLAWASCIPGSFVALASSST